MIADSTVMNIRKQHQLSANMLPAPTSNCGSLVGKILMGLLVLIASPTYATLTIVTEGSSSYRANYFYSVSYDGDGSGPSLTGLVFDLDAGGGGGVFDANNGNGGSIGLGSRTFGGGIWADYVYQSSGEAGIYFESGYFDSGNSLNFGYDTDYLDGGGTFGASDNSGGAFGASDVSVTATFDDGTSITETFTQDSATRSTAVLNAGVGTFTTEFSLEDVVANRGEEIPLNIDRSANENTSDYYISGLPEGVVLSEGVEVGDGSWIVPSVDIGNLAIVPSQIYTGQFLLTINQDIANVLTAGSSGTFGGGSSDRASLSSANTDFSYDSSGSVSDNSFILTNDAQTGSSSWSALEDRNEGGYGYFLLGNASGDNRALLKDNISGLSINTTYHISGFVANVHPSEMAELSFRVNGAEIFSTGLIDSGGSWQEFGGSYTTATNTAATFEVVSVNYGAIALDDVLFSESFEDNMLVTIHDAAFANNPLYYNFTFTNSNSVAMTVNFVDTLPEGLTWDPKYLPITDGLEVPTLTFSNGDTTATINGLELPPGTTQLSIRTAATTAIGDYSNTAQVTVADEDFLSETFSATASFTVIGN
ncbi:hypothetical protein OAG35_01000 [bacterium]|nr:hypothetical protein [bacterium]